MATVVDYSAAPIAAQSVKNAGHIGAVRYISDARLSTMRGKPIRSEEAFDYWSNGLEIAFVWQYGKDHNSDVRRGYQGGFADASEAAKRIEALGAKPQPCYFAVDFNITLDEWNSFGIEYFRGACDAIGKERVGIYGHSRVCSWAIEDGVVGESPIRGKYWAWQTKAWSTPNTITDGVVLFQRVVDTPSNPGPKIDGITVDVSDVLSPEWGQNPVGAKPAPVAEKPRGEVVLTGNQFQADVDDLGDNDSGWRDKSTIVQAFVHTVENPSDRDPLNVSRWQDTSNTGSYHILVGGDGKTVRSNDDDYITWSAGWTANRIGLHVSCCGYSADSRDQWLARDAQLRSVARILSDWCVRYNIEPRKINADEVRGLVRGIAGHGDAAQAWHETDHTDPGANFPWDIVFEYVRQIINGSTVAVSNDEDDDLMSALDEVFEANGNPEYRAPLKKFILNADDHAYNARVNSEAILLLQKDVLNELKNINISIQGLTEAIKKGQ